MQRTRASLKATRLSEGMFIGGIAFAVYECGECGVLFALTKSYIENRGQDGERWHCPNGHPWVFTGKTREQKLQAELERERDHSAWLVAELDQKKASLRATKGVVTRKRKELARVKAGVCPCCSRTFQNLARHMKSKHPEFEP